MAEKRKYLEFEKYCILEGRVIKERNTGSETGKTMDKEIEGQPQHIEEMAAINGSFKKTK